ncbi:histidine kinase [Dactylosporangium sp. NPDC005572]|uniref:sensor histidine kinase n=1 Tax=Dactylosporangium sp. NPDC005572 TaxID=3156889 RepID=UPI0033B932F1
MTAVRSLRPRRAAAALVWVLGAVVAAETVVTVAAWATSGMTAHMAVDSFVITHGAAGLALLCCGGPLAWHRPRSPIGWLFVGSAIGHSTAAMMPPLIVWGMSDSWPVPALRALTAIGVYAWPWTVTVGVPVALIVFPDGRLPGRRWRPALLAVLVIGVLFTLSSGLDPTGFHLAGAPAGYLSLTGFAGWHRLWAVADLAGFGANVLAAVALVVRYRRGDEVVRRQLLWLVLAAVVAAAVIAPFVLARRGPVLALLAVNLIPIAVTVAILRYQLLDIRLVVSRAVAYALLSVGVVGLYVGMVAVFDAFARRQVGLGSSLLATVVIAIGFNPVRVWLQRRVDTALYGQRADPLRAVSRVGDRLVTGPDAGLPGVLVAMADALRLPYAALEPSIADRDDDLRPVNVGSPPVHTHRLPLRYTGAQVGVLEVGLRPGETRIAPADLAVLRALAPPLALAIHVTALSTDVRRSRERIVDAREHERQRLRRDLHDGLGPILTGISFQAQAVHNLIEPADATVSALLTAIRDQALSAIEQVRQLIEELRPSELDGLGLADALRQRARHLSHRPAGPPLTVNLHHPEPLPALPAPVEVVAYRIGVEALTNVVRHTTATAVDITIVVDDELTISVCDNNTSATPWSEGNGLRSIRYRAAEIGGVCTAGPGPQGGHVLARLPLTAHQQQRRQPL